MAIDPRQITKSFTLMGSSFIPGAGGLIDKLKSGQPLALLRQPNNEHDKNAVLVMWGKRPLGYLPRQLAAEVAPMMDADVPVIVRKSPPLPNFGAYRGILELAYVPPEPASEQKPNPERADTDLRDGSTNEEVPNDEREPSPYETDWS